jgi:hypothetical protein
LEPGAFKPLKTKVNQSYGDMLPYVIKTASMKLPEENNYDALFLSPNSLLRMFLA